MQVTNRPELLPDVPSPSGVGLAGQEAPTEVMMVGMHTRMRRLTSTLLVALALGAAAGCGRGGAAPPPTAQPCDKTVDNCPGPQPVAGEGEAPVAPPPGDPSTNNPATPPPAGRPPR
jgi:predicted small lipoprotein YifL